MMDLKEISKAVQSILLEKNVDREAKYKLTITTLIQTGYSYMSQLFRVQVESIAHHHHQDESQLDDTFKMSMANERNQDICLYSQEFELKTDRKISNGTISNWSFIENGDNKRSKEKIVLNFIIKIPCSSEMLQQQCNVSKLYDQEHFFYHKVLPAFLKIKFDSNINGNYLNSFAKTYYTHNKTVLIMEDLTTKGFQCPSRTEPLDFHHSQLVIEELAKMHAFSFIMRSENPVQFQHLANNIPEKLFTGQYSPKVQFVFQKTIDFAIKILDENLDCDVIDKLKDFRDNFCDEMAFCVATKSAEQYAAICHGDSWIGNFMFEYNNTTSPKDVRILDWQVARVASPITDIAYFIYTCTDSKTRSGHLEDLLGLYYHTLAKTIHLLGGDCNELFPYKVYRDHLKRFSKYGLGMAIIIMHTCVCADEDLPDVDTILNKTCENYFEEVMVPLIKNTKYINRISGVAKDIVRFGFI